MAKWERVHAEPHADGSRGRWTWRLKVTGGWLVLVRVVDDGIWGGVTFVPDPDHACPPDTPDE